MKKKPTEDELRELANWLTGIMQAPEWQRFGDLVRDRMVGMTQKILVDKEDNPWQRGYICGVQWVLKGKPEELIRQTQNVDRDTGTP